MMNILFLLNSCLSAASGTLNSNTIQEMNAIKSNKEIMKEIINAFSLYKNKAQESFKPLVQTNGDLRYAKIMTYHHNSTLLLIEQFFEIISVLSDDHICRKLLGLLGDYILDLCDKEELTVSYKLACKIFEEVFKINDLVNSELAEINKECKKNKIKFYKEKKELRNLHKSKEKNTRLNLKMYYEGLDEFGMLIATKIIDFVKSVNHTGNINIDKSDKKIEATEPENVISSDSTSFIVVKNLSPSSMNETSTIHESTCSENPLGKLKTTKISDTLNFMPTIENSTNDKENFMDKDSVFESNNEIPTPSISFYGENNHSSTILEGKDELKTNDTISADDKNILTSDKSLDKNTIDKPTGNINDMQMDTNMDKNTENVSISSVDKNILSPEDVKNDPVTNPITSDDIAITEPGVTMENNILNATTSQDEEKNLPTNENFDCINTAAGPITPGNEINKQDDINMGEPTAKITENILEAEKTDVDNNTTVSPISSGLKNILPFSENIDNGEIAAKTVPLAGKDNFMDTKITNGEKSIINSNTLIPDKGVIDCTMDENMPSINRNDLQAEGNSIASQHSYDEPISLRNENVIKTTGVDNGNNLNPLTEFINSVESQEAITDKNIIESVEIKSVQEEQVEADIGTDMATNEVEKLNGIKVEKTIPKKEFGNLDSIYVGNFKNEKTDFNNPQNSYNEPVNSDYDVTKDQKSRNLSSLVHPLTNTVDDLNEGPEQKTNNLEISGLDKKDENVSFNGDFGVPSKTYSSTFDQNPHVSSSSVRNDSIKETSLHDGSFFDDNCEKFLKPNNEENFVKIAEERSSIINKAIQGSIPTNCSSTSYERKTALSDSSEKETNNTTQNVIQDILEKISSQFPEEESIRNEFTILEIKNTDIENVEKSKNNDITEDNVNQLIDETNHLPIKVKDYVLATQGIENLSNCILNEELNLPVNNNEFTNVNESQPSESVEVLETDDASDSEYFDVQDEHVINPNDTVSFPQSINLPEKSSKNFIEGENSQSEAENLLIEESPLILQSTSSGIASTNSLHIKDDKNIKTGITLKEYKTMILNENSKQVSTEFTQNKNVAGINVTLHESDITEENIEDALNINEAEIRSEYTILDSQSSENINSDSNILTPEIQKRATQHSDSIIIHMTDFVSNQANAANSFAPDFVDCEENCVSLSFSNGNQLFTHQDENINQYAIITENRNGDTAQPPSINIEGLTDDDMNLTTKTRKYNTIVIVALSILPVSATAYFFVKKFKSVN